MKNLISVMLALILVALQVRAFAYNGYEASVQARDRAASQQMQNRSFLVQEGPETSQSAMQSLQGTMGGLSGLSNEQAAQTRRWQMDTMQKIQQDEGANH
ncbi:MAG: hypothetical protein KGI54_06415 [Pseudomonadota bacterium]|nr:hypothetical protein [Pseudomonadota bacterium]